MEKNINCEHEIYKIFNLLKLFNVLCVKKDGMENEKGLDEKSINLCWFKIIGKFSRSHCEMIVLLMK